MQIFYIFVAGGGYLVYLYFGFLELFDDNPLVSHLDSVLGSAMAVYCFHAFYQACTFRPGIILKANYKEYV